MDTDKDEKKDRVHGRRETPRSGLEENLPYRISGLEQAKAEPGMTPQDIAALDRVIDKLKAKLAEKNPPKETQEI